MNYTINISLPKQLAELAQRQVKSGLYGSLSEVIRDALRRMLNLDVPAFRMSKKAERRALKALKEYREGKTKPIQSINELLSL